MLLHSDSLVRKVGIETVWGTLPILLLIGFKEEFRGDHVIVLFKKKRVNPTNSNDPM